MAASTVESNEPRRVLIASLNPGKAVGLATLARCWGLSPVSASELGLLALEEDGATFVSNAEAKARAACAATGLPALADDSGVVLPTHPEAAGVHTARWAKAKGGYDPAVASLFDAATTARAKLEAVYICALCYALPDGRTLFGEGRAPGELVHPARGVGPGIWPFFLPSGSTRSLAQLDEEQLTSAHPRREAGEALEHALRAQLLLPG